MNAQGNKEPCVQENQHCIPCNLFMTTAYTGTMMRTQNTDLARAQSNNQQPNQLVWGNNL